MVVLLLPSRCCNHHLMIGGVTVRLQSKARELAPKVPNVLAGSTAAIHPYLLQCTGCVAWRSASTNCDSLSPINKCGCPLCSCDQQMWVSPLFMLAKPDRECQFVCESISPSLTRISISPVSSATKSDEEAESSMYVAQSPNREGKNGQKRCADSDCHI